MTAPFLFLLLVIVGVAAVGLGLAWAEHRALRAEQEEWHQRVLDFYGPRGWRR